MHNRLWAIMTELKIKKQTNSPLTATINFSQVGMIQIPFRRQLPRGVCIAQLHFCNKFTLVLD